MSPDGRLLELQGVRAGYDSAEVLHGIDLAVGRGEVLAMLGPNGAGKSTTLKVIAGLLRPTSGTVRFDGRDLAGHSAAERARIGLYLVPEGRAVFASLTVADNLRLASGAPEQRLAQRVADALDLFPVLASRREQLAGTLSGGEQRMLALARAFVADPLLLLLDEPSLGLAPLVIDDVFDVIARFAAAGIAIVLVEQYVQRALDVADRVCVLGKGHVTFAGSPRQLATADLAASYLG